MKTLYLILTSTLILIGISSKAQYSKIIIDDQSGLTNDVSISHMMQKLLTNNFMLDEFLDYEKRCEYLFIELRKTETEFTLRARDCNKILIESIKFDHDITLADDVGVGNALASSIITIAEHENKIATVNSPATSSTNQKKQNNKIGYENHHDSRHFFSPTAYNLRKGQLYYNTTYGLVHDLQYGLSDNFSIGLGTTIIGFPAYVTPKLSIQVADNVALMAGDIFVFGTYGLDFYANIAYAGITLGSRSNNITIAGGPATSSEFSSTAVLNISGMLAASKYIYFISENYITTDDFFAGFSGVRIISKQKDVQSFQLGFMYFIPGFVAPGLSYTLKFGKIY
jgi:hypothetical protein